MKRKITAIILMVALVLALALPAAVVGASPGTTVTLDIPEYVYRPVPFDATSTTTNDGTAYTNVRFNITVDGPVDFTGDRADTFTITHLNGSTDTQGINTTFVLVSGDFVGFWGPAGGFPLPAPYGPITSTFTIQMNDDTTAPVGNYDVTVELVDLTGPTTLATATDSFSLSAYPELAALWHLDEGSGGTAYDSTVNANDGTISGAVYAGSANAMFGDALSFDGTDDYVSVPDSASLDSMNALTVEAWIYIDSAGSGYRGIVDKTAGSGDRSYNIGLRNGKLEWGLANASNAKTTITDTVAASAGTWTHVAGTYDGSTMKLYKNGVEVASGSQTGNVQDSSTYLALGQWPGLGGTYFFDGTIDEVRIWNGALTANQIKASFNKGLWKQWIGVDDSENADANLGDHIGVELDVIVTGPSVTVIDTLPSEVRYRPGFFRVNGVVVDPQPEVNVVGGQEEISYDLTETGAYTIDFKVQVVSAEAEDTTVENTAMADGASASAELVIHPYEGFTKEIDWGWKVHDGEDYELPDPTVVPIGTDVHWIVDIVVTNILGDSIATMEDVVVKDRFGGDLELDKIDDGAKDPPEPTEKKKETVDWGFTGSNNRGTVQYTGKTNKVHLTWDVGTLVVDGNKTLSLEISTDENPGKGKNDPHQEYTSPGWNDLNSGAVVKFIDAGEESTGFQLSAHTPALSVYVPDGMLTLHEKTGEPDWDIVDADAGASGVLYFSTSADKFYFVFQGEGLEATTGYSLIYYADPWPGNNPGAWIAAGTSDGSGNIVLSGSTDLGIDLPDLADANYLDGAKIWLVLSSDYNSNTASTGPMTGWNPTEYLFEHNLITYTDTGP